MKQIAVIGAGMAGAGAAHKLSRAGHQVTVYEKESWAGGRSHTHRGKGFRVNTGAGFFTNFYPRLRKLLSELDLSSEVIENPKVVTLATPDRKYDYKLDSVVSFLRIPWLTFSDKVRLIRHTAGLTARKRSLDLAEPKSLALRDNDNIRDYALRKLGQRNYDFLVRSAIEPYWYFSCADASSAMLDGLQAHAAGARFFTLKGGMDTLVTRLLADHDVQYGTSAQAILPGSRDKVSLVLENGATPDFDAVVVATTAPVASRLVQDWTALPGFSRQFIASQRYAANINAYFHVSADLVEGFSPQTSPCGGTDDELAAIAVHGAQIDSKLWPGQAIIGVWLTDAGSRQHLDTPETELADHLWAQVRRYYPDFPTHTPRMAHLTRRSEAIPVHAPGRYRDAARILEEQRGPVVLAGDYLATATMEGALNSGYRAAENLMKQWK